MNSGEPYDKNNSDIRLVVLCPDITVEKVPEIDNITLELLGLVDRFSNTRESGAYVHLICVDKIESIGGSYMHLIATIRIYREKNTGLPILIFQRLFTARIDITDIDNYLPIESYAQIIEKYFGGEVIRGNNLFRFHTSGNHGALLSWAIKFDIPQNTHLRRVFDQAISHIERIEQIYASRMVYVDNAKPWNSFEKIDEGRKLSPWEIESFKADGIEIMNQFGKGGLSTIWLGRSVDNGNEIIIKLLAPDLRFREIEKLKERFSKEFYIGQRLKSLKCVPEFYSIGEVFDRSYFTQEYFPWQNLKDHAESDDFNICKRERVLSNLVHAISEIHNKGVIHRDISPKNVLVGPEQQVLIIDFGAATLNKETFNDYDISFDITLPFQHFGSLKYSAPELRDNPCSITEKADIYSVGIIIYEILLRKNIAGNLPHLSDLGIKLDKRLSEFAFQAVSFSMEDRPDATTY